MFVFEGRDAEWQADDLMSNFRRPLVREAIEAWKPLLAARPRVAREAYFWARSGGGADQRSAGSS